MFSAGGKWFSQERAKLLELNFFKRKTFHLMVKPGRLFVLFSQLVDLPSTQALITPQLSKTELTIGDKVYTTKC